MKDETFNSPEVHDYPVAGSGCTKCPPGEHRDMRHGQLVAQPSMPIPDETCAACGVFRPGHESSDHTFVAQPPAPDPDETCPKRVDERGHLFSEREGRCIYCSTPIPASPATTEPDRHDRGCAADICSSARCQCASPVTTGPADEAEGLAEVLDSIVAWVEGWIANRVAAPTIIRAEAKMLLNRHADVLSARDAAQQRIGAEKAGERIAQQIKARCRHFGQSIPGPCIACYDAARIAREGQT